MKEQLEALRKEIVPDELDYVNGQIYWLESVQKFVSESLRIARQHREFVGNIYSKIGKIIDGDEG